MSPWCLVTTLLLIEQFLFLSSVLSLKHWYDLNTKVSLNQKTAASEEERQSDRWALGWFRSGKILIPSLISFCFSFLFLINFFWCSEIVVLIETPLIFPIIPPVLSARLRFVSISSILCSLPLVSFSFAALSSPPPLLARLWITIRRSTRQRETI